MMNDEHRPTRIWQEFQKGIQYLQNKGLINEWEQCENFYEGRQWPEPTKRTRNLPRPVINICAMIADNKKAGILSGNVKMIYRPSEMFGEYYEKAEQGADLFTKFAESVSKELKQADLDEIAQSYATQLGTYIYHYYWDITISGGMQTPYLGALRGEVIHPKNIIFSNPSETDVQKQKYIIIASCEPVESVRALAKSNGISEWENITSDTEMEESEELGDKMCTVLTRYSRQNGRVVWEKSTKYCYVSKPMLWEPDKSKVKFDEDEEEINEPDNSDEKKFIKKQLYPIVVKQHKKRKRCIYGIGEISQAIPNNKSVNFNIAMMLLSVQQTGWPKILQKVNALANQQITNEPGEVLTDTTAGQGWGVKYLETPGFNAQAIPLTDKIIDLTRTVSGSTEVVTGEVIGANMAASAIIALQNQAKKPIEMYQQNFYRAYEDIGKIYEQFFKYYYNDGRLFQYEDDEEKYITSMNGNDYQNFDYATAIEVGSKGTFSESLTVSLLDNLVASQAIDIDDYIELYPESIMTFKAKLKRIRQKKQEEMLQQQLLSQQAQSVPQMPNEISQNLQ